MELEQRVADLEKEVTELKLLFKKHKGIDLDEVVKALIEWDANGAYQQILVNLENNLKNRFNISTRTNCGNTLKHSL